MKKRAPKYMTKPTGKMPKQIGAVTVKEVPYKDGWVVDLTWRGADTPSGRGHKQRNNWPHALELAAKVNKRLDELKEKGAGRYTFNDAADSFLKECDALSKRKDNTGFTLDSYDIYERIVDKHLRPKFGRMRLTEITSRGVKDWLIEQAQIAKPRTMKGRLAILKLVLNHAAEHEMIVVNPLKVKNVRLPGKIDNRAKIPDRSDLETLREYLNGPRPLQHGRSTWSCTRMVAVLAVSCGLRSEEASALQWDDINRENGDINIDKARGRRQGLKAPKTEAGIRTIHTTPAVQAIIEEHAEVYRELYGKCVGHVLRSAFRDYISPSRISGMFLDAMRACGLVEPGTNKIKFSHHKGRHWSASNWMKGSRGDIHLVKRLMGHKNASMTLDIYGHCIDDPDAREKFQRMPGDWLTPIVEIDASSATQPIEMPESPLALPAPEDFEFGPRVEVNGQAEADCPIDVPDIAEPWVKPLIRLLHQGMPILDAYSEISPMMPNLRSTKNPTPLKIVAVKRKVQEEFRRLKLPPAPTIVARFLAEKILRLHGEKYQALDIARLVGCSPGHVTKVLISRHKPNANNPLNRKLKSPFAKRAQTLSEHKIQPKLL